jgi:alcohol dehydrogenase class IV
MFSISDERAGKVLERLKLQGVISIQGLEKLMLVLEKRAKDSNFIRVLQELKENKITIKTYDDLKRNLDEKIFDKSIKDVFV